MMGHRHILLLEGVDGSGKRVRGGRLPCHQDHCRHLMDHNEDDGVDGDDDEDDEAGGDRGEGGGDEGGGRGKATSWTRRSCSS